MSARLTAEAGRWHGAQDADVDAAVPRADAAVAGLRATFLATPYRPSGLTTAARAVVRLIDEVIWLDVVLNHTAATGHTPGVDPTVRAVKTAAAVLLEHAGMALSLREPPQDSLQDHLDDLARARREMEAVAIADATPPRDARTAEDLVDSLSPGFRAEELSFAVLAIAENIAIATAAEQRAWWQKLLGRQPRGRAGPLTSAQERALAHLDPHSVWLRNSLRGAIALGGAVLVADLSDLQHSFWIVLGALSVLRSNALSTGQSVVRGPGRDDDRVRRRRSRGVPAGHGPGAALGAARGDPGRRRRAGGLVHRGAGGLHRHAVDPVQHHQFGGVAGRAGAHRARRHRLRDEPGGRGALLAAGCGRGAPAGPGGGVRGVRRLLADGRRERRGARGIRGPGSAEEAAARARAAAAARRLDDAFREYLAERGRKQLNLGEVGSLLSGAAGLRLTADAVSDLWAGAGPDRVDTPRAQPELIVATERVTNWFAAMAQAVAGVGPVPRPLPQDGASARRLVEALAQDLEPVPAPATSVKAHTVRLTWTSDHMDTARRLQDLVEQPSRTAARAARHVGPSLP